MLGDLEAHVLKVNLRVSGRPVGSWVFLLHSDQILPVGLLGHEKQISSPSLFTIAQGDQDRISESRPALPQ